MRDFNTRTETPEEGAERRRHPRRQRSLRLQFYRATAPGRDSQPLQLLANSADISRSGFRLILDASFKAGTVLEFWVELPPDGKPTGHRYMLAGVVRWQQQVVGEKRWITGLELVDMPTTDYERWFNEVY